MENDKTHDYTDAYLESYLRALDKTHNPDLAIQTAMGVTMVLRMIDAQNEPKQPAQPQINPMAALFGAMMQQAAKNQQEEGTSRKKRKPDTVAKIRPGKMPENKARKNIREIFSGKIYAKKSSL